MKLKTATCDARELPQGKSAPSVIHLLPNGTFKGRDGRSWTLDDPARLIAQHKARKIDLPIDYEHQGEDSSRAQNGPVPAAGWITALEARSDGIWGHVKWTKTAANMIQEREYRFISPTFKYASATRKIMALTSAGLVHNPNLHLTALAREETAMTGDPASLSDFATALGLPENAERFEILAAINSQAEPDPAKYVPIEAVKDLMKDRTSKIAIARESDVETIVNDALDKGYITPGMIDWATALCRQAPESFAEFTSSSVPAYSHLFKSPMAGRSLPEGKSRSYDEAELAICAQLDLEPGTLLKS